MDKLWAPWRINYIKNKKSKKCVFCEQKSYLLFKTQHSLAMLNKFPYNNGHVMVAPLRHIGKTGRLREEEALDLFRCLNRVISLLEKVLRPQGYNVGINLSAAAGAGIPGHLHIHIVPRWKADSNFMPVVFDTKVISQSLDELCRQLKNAQSKPD
ncbi:MAG: hypothetical protein A3G38_03105 [Omnitrophica WOR_2 bacterium RIFCSPLOWO2_12_FULL_51_8]|nr:MAG: hypothetical protein A3G38_03105 [Omnitrophica WOR_2 bacterium RIFCSPLOWO2_12_FULL_51_8]